MKTYTCVRCGKQFQANHRTAACAECHTAVCVICGKTFDLQPPWTQQTCSRECRGKYVKEAGIAKARTAKAHKTIEAKGFKNLRELQRSQTYTKNCKYCGAEFSTNDPRQEYCKGPHYGPCPACGKLTEIKELYIGPQACSDECRQKLIGDTCEERYGNRCFLASDLGKAMTKETLQTKFNVDYYSQTQEFQDKYTATMLAKTGYKYPRQDPETNSRAIATTNALYGGNSATCDPEVMAKARATAEQNDGGFGFAGRETSKKIFATNMKRYNTPYPMQTDPVKQKAQKTNLAKRGTTNFRSSLDGAIASILDPSKAEKFQAFRTDPKSFIAENYPDVDRLSVKKLCEDLGCTDTPVYNILIKHGCRDLATFRASRIEDEIVEFLNDIHPGIQIVRNTRKVISPQEIDIYLPEYNIGIECNPTITHNSSISDPWEGDPKPYTYHQIKSLKAIEAGVFLFHIFGYEWTNHSDILKSMLINLLHCDSTKLQARKCYVCELPNSECKEFLNSNHRQGHLFASVRLGLKLQATDELVSVMTFNKMRPTIGKVDDSEGSWELSRFCNKLCTSVAGGASKLLAYFLKTHCPSKIVSFSDVAHTRGRLYSTLGFHKVSESDPGYVWVDYQTDRYFNRVSCQKSNLRKLFHDDSIDIANKTEREIMEEHGYVRVYDSGVIRWELDL